MTDSGIRIGADVGGTFTDVVLEKGTDLFSTKVLTTYESPEIGILEGIATVIAKSGTDFSQISSFIHGTTLATNALISRTGAKTAFVTTKGFRDTIEMRTESRFEQYNLNLELPKPLIERKDRYVLSERISAEGTVLLPFDEIEAQNLIKLISKKKPFYNENQKLEKTTFRMIYHPTPRKSTGRWVVDRPQCSNPAKIARLGAEAVPE